MWQIAPCLLGGERKNRRDQPDEIIGYKVHNRLRRTAGYRVLCLAIKSVLRDIDIELRQVDGAEIVNIVINDMELISVI